MENNIINLEEEYFKKKNKEVYQKLMNKEFQKVTELLVEPIAKIENSVKEKIYCPQNIFEAGIFLNFLDEQIEQKDFAKVNYYDFYLMDAAAKYNLKMLDESKDDYKKAIEFNPASSIARLQVLEINKIQKNYDTFLDDIREVFKYAYRRKDLAKAYRYTGFYLAEKQDYKMALVAYYISNAYELSDESIEEIDHIAKEANIDLDSEAWLSEANMREFHKTYDIPLLPSEKLSTLAIAMGDDASSKNAKDVALFSYQIAYELTLEEQYKTKIEEICNLKK